MSNSEFWARLAKEFRELDCECIHLDFDIAEDDPEQIQIAMFAGEDGACISKRKSLEALSLKAGNDLDPNAPDPVLVWVKRLIRDREVPRDYTGSSVHIGADNVERTWKHSRISNPCTASAIVSSSLQLDRLTAELRPKADSPLPAPASASGPIPIDVSKLQVFQVGPTIEEQAEADALRQFLINKRLREMEAEDNRIILDKATIQAIVVKQREHVGHRSAESAKPGETAQRVEKTVRRRAKTNATRRTERSPLFEIYTMQFAEKIVILDVCWAAKQYYREWKRWRSGEAKDGSTPDKAFRAILASPLRPSEYRVEPRPPKWK